MGSMSDDAAIDQTTGRVDGEQRKALAKPVLDDLVAWLERERPIVTANRMETAMGYIERQWIPLTRFLDDGTLRLDNNPSELALRHQVVGRKNWLFCATDGGGYDNAIVVSLIASCKMHDVEPWEYLRDILVLLPEWPVHRALELAPLHWQETRQKPEVVEIYDRRQLLGRVHRPKDVQISDPSA
jgi:transposase